MQQPTITRWAPDWYQMQSFTRPNKWYDLRYNHKYGRWVCECPDAQGPRLNPRCKHRVALCEHVRAEIELRRIIRGNA